MRAAWRTVRIDELGEVIGGRQRSPHLTKGRLRPYLRVANVFDGYVDASDVKSMAFTDNEFKIYKLRQGDILLNEGQSLELVGRAAMYRGTPSTCAFQNTLVRIRPYSSTDPAYLEYLMRYLHWRGRFSRIASRTTSMAHLGVSRLAGLRVRVPDRLTQERISGVLDDVSARLNTASNLAIAKERLKRGLIEEVLSGRRRFAKYASQPWHEVRIGDVFDERNESGRSDLPLLSITGSRGVIVRDDLVRRDSSAKDKSAYKRIVPGDIGYNTMRMWQGVSGRSRFEGIVSPAYTVLVPRPGRILSEYAAHLFKMPSIIDRFRRLSQGLVDDTLSLKFSALARVRLSLPGMDEQKCVALLLDSADAEIAALSRLKDELNRQRLSLMHHLLTEAAHK